MTPFPGGAAAVTTARLDLLPLDAAAVSALIEGDRLPCWAPDFPQPLDVDAAYSVFRDGLAPAIPALGYRLIRERDGGLAIGTVGFTGPPAAGTVELSFSVVPSRRGQGLGREAVEAAARSALAAPGLDSVIAFTAADNAASGALLLSAGFRMAAAVPGSAPTDRSAPADNAPPILRFELRSGQLPPASFAADAK